MDIIMMRNICTCYIEKSIYGVFLFTTELAVNKYTSMTPVNVSSIFLKSINREQRV